MADVIKSIFRQREIEKLYRLEIVESTSLGYFYNSTSAVQSRGNEERVISDKEIGRYDIEIPMLEVGDEFFLHDIQEVVVIKSKMRSSDGSVTYYVKDKIVETENTKKSYEECTKKVEHWGYEKERFEELEKKFKDYKREYKYKNRFFNKKQS